MTTPRVPPARPPSRVLAVVGASGGCGASTLAVACALVLADSGRRVVAVDAHPGGAGLDVLLGIEHLPGLRWPELSQCRGVDGPAVLAGLPRLSRNGTRGRSGRSAPGPVGELAVLAHGRDGRPGPDEPAAGAVVAALGDCVDDLIVDLPRGAVAGSWWPPVDAAVIVAGCGIVELAALAATAAGLAPRVAETFVCLRGSGRARAVAGDVEAALDLPVLAVVPDDPGVARAVARGEPPAGRAGPVRRAAERVIDHLRAGSGRTQVAS